MSVIKFIGRVLIITAILSSAYFHLEHPENSLQQFQSNYVAIDNISQTYLQYDLPLDNTNWKTAIKIFGIFEVLVVFFIVLGEGLGATLYLVTIVGQILFLILGKFISKTIQQWSGKQLEQTSHLTSLLGIALILACSSCNKQKCQK